eukprot:gene11098-23199_t
MDTSVSDQFSKQSSSITSHPYESAIEKLKQASWQFSRERNGVEITAFECKDIDKQRFRHQLRCGLGCRISSFELDALMPTLDTSQNGTVDGIEFLGLFFRLRYEVKNKILTDRINTENERKRSVKVREQKRLTAITQSVSKVDVNFDYTEDDSKNAQQKLLAAAVLHDNLKPGSTELQAFDAEFLPPHTLKDQIVRLFNVKLNPSELGALIRLFPHEDDNTNINCARFLVWFFKTGFEEKYKYNFEKRQETKRINDDKEKLHKKFLEEAEKKIITDITTKFSEEDKISAMEKLQNAAKLYNKNDPGVLPLDSLEVAYMPPHIFCDKLKRIFNLKLTPNEQGSIVATFDGGAGQIDCVEFLKQFQTMGIKEREKETNTIKEKQRRIEEKRKHDKEHKEKLLMEGNHLQRASVPFSEDDLSNAMGKLASAAWQYDRSKDSNIGLNAFEAKSMLAHVFKEQLKHVFNVNVTAAELSALMSYFDKENTGSINCAEFLVNFFHTGFEERSRRARLWRRHDENKIEQRKREIQRRDKEILDKQAIKISALEFTEEDFQSGIAKLTEAAIKHDRNSTSAIGLGAFESESMPPHIFKEQLKRVFNIILSPAELSALMSYFDKENRGSINCAEFLIQFFRTGLEERNRIHAQHLEMQHRKELKDLELQHKRTLENEARVNAHVDFNFSEDEFDGALSKFITMCHKLDRRQFGPSSMKAFEIDAMTPSEFRELMKRTFNLKLLPQELGALVTLFDPQATGFVSCPAFMYVFTQTRVKVEEFK